MLYRNITYYIEILYYNLAMTKNNLAHVNILPIQELTNQHTFGINNINRDISRDLK